MRKSFIFAAGLVAGIGATALAAATLRPWSQADVVVANALFHPRSGLHFGVVNPPEPDRKQILHVLAQPSTQVDEAIAVSVNPPEPDFPPDPCFTAVVEPPPDPDRPTVAVTVLHPEQISFSDANGDALALCSAAGVPVSSSK
jgi:hypothetical protein